MGLTIETGGRGQYCLFWGKILHIHGFCLEVTEYIWRPKSIQGHLWITMRLHCVQCLRYKILPSLLCAEICCNRGIKGLSGRIWIFMEALLCGAWILHTWLICVGHKTFRNTDAQQIVKSTAPFSTKRGVIVDKSDLHRKHTGNVIVCMVLGLVRIAY